jgi:serine/threonine-protein kinase
MLTASYELLTKIGQGGMGIVHRARHRETGKIYAVKLMTPEAAGDALLRGRFEQEFLANCRLRHPNLVRGYACDMQAGQPYFVMELVEGPTLGERIATQGRLANEEALQIIVQIADALRLAHESNMVHRDVKPDNILLGTDGQARLTDLGLVKDFTLHTELTTAGMGLGTLSYVAPEQAENARAADARSDIYGLGATLYHALTGVPPFQGRVRLVVLKKQTLNQFIPPRQLVPTIPRFVDQAICRALDGRPDRRQQSCREFIASLLPGTGTDRADPGQKSRLDSAGEVSPAYTQGPERRKAPRFSCDLLLQCGPGWSRTNRFQGKLLDISLSGIQVLLPRRFEPGAILTGEIFNHQQEPTLHLVVKIRWVKKVGERAFVLGCAFHREICLDDLSTILGNDKYTSVVSGFVGE